MKYKYTRKECNKEIETIKRIFSGSQIMPGGWLETVAQYLHATQLMLLAQKEDRKEHAYFTSPIFHEKTITTPSPLEIEEIEEIDWVRYDDGGNATIEMILDLSKVINKLIKNNRILVEIIKSLTKRNIK